MNLRAAVKQLTRRQIICLTASVAALIVIACLYRRIDVEALHRRAEELNGPSVFIAITLLPLVCFPVSVMHAIAGVRFGLALGIPLVACSICLQLLLAYLLVRLLPDFFSRHFDKLRRRLPHAAHGPLTLFTMLLPGMPYFAQIYVLPLVGVPLRIYLAYSLPINIARSLIGVLFGHLSDHLTPLRLSGFVVYTIVITLACAWSFRRLQRKLKDRPAAADGPKPRASARSAARKPAQSRNAGR
jgi:uncharacterized membrane protein YdjX (TVP38/TMEM64 family)